MREAIGWIGLAFFRVIRVFRGSTLFVRKQARGTIDGAALINMSTLISHKQERRQYAEFAARYSEEEYRERLADAYHMWSEFNERYYGGRLVEPHLAFGRTASRSLGHCTATTDYGGQVQIVLNAGLVLEANEEWIRRRWPAEGTRRFVHDLLLRFTVAQYLMEERGARGRTCRGHGRPFADEANRIGALMGLQRVVVRRRLYRKRDGFPCHGWPHCVRPAGYYGDDITERLLQLATGTTSEKKKRGSFGVLKMVRRLLYENRSVEALRMIEEHLAELPDAVDAVE